MSQVDPLFDYKADRHQKSRSVGLLRAGPIQRDGYINNTKKTLVGEMPYSDSIEPTYYTSKNKIYGNKNELMKSRRLKMVSRGDEF